MEGELQYTCSGVLNNNSSLKTELSWLVTEYRCNEKFDKDDMQYVYNEKEKIGICIDCTNQLKLMRRQFFYWICHRLSDGSCPDQYSGYKLLKERWCTSQILPYIIKYFGIYNSKHRGQYNKKNNYFQNELIEIYCHAQRGYRPDLHGHVLAYQHNPEHLSNLRIKIDHKKNKIKSDAIENYAHNMVMVIGFSIMKEDGGKKEEFDDIKRHFTDDLICVILKLVMSDAFFFFENDEFQHLYELYHQYYEGYQIFKEMDRLLFLITYAWGWLGNNCNILFSRWNCDSMRYGNMFENIDEYYNEDRASFAEDDYYVQNEKKKILNGQGMQKLKNDIFMNLFSFTINCITLPPVDVDSDNSGFANIFINGYDKERRQQLLNYWNNNTAPNGSLQGLKIVANDDLTQWRVTPFEKVTLTLADETFVVIQEPIKHSRHKPFV